MLQSSNEGIVLADSHSRQRKRGVKEGDDEQEENDGSIMAEKEDGSHIGKRLKAIPFIEQGI